MIEFVEDESVSRWVVKKMNNAGYPLTMPDVGPNVAVGAVRNGKPLMGVIYNWFRPHPLHESANDVNVIIARSQERFKKNDVLPFFFNYAYGTLQCGRITAIVAEGNKPSVTMVKRLGFRKEGTIRRGYDGKKNAIIFGQLKSECPFL